MLCRRGPGAPGGGGSSGCGPKPEEDSPRALHHGRAGPRRVLDDKVWTEAKAGTEFIQREPDTGTPASQRTEVRVVYTSTTLYIGLSNYDTEAHRIISKEMQRDQPLWRDDAVDVVIDTFGDHRNAYLFETNPNGARTDALISDEGRDFNLSWNGVWQVASRRTPEGWFSEMAIPFSTLRFDPGRDGVGTERAPLRPPPRRAGLLVAHPPRRRRQARLAVRRARPGFATPGRDGAST